MAFLASLGDARWTWPALGPPPGGVGEHTTIKITRSKYKTAMYAVVMCAGPARGGGRGTNRMCKHGWNEWGM